MNMADKLFAIADVVGFVVFGIGEDHQDAVGREVVHLAPKAWADKYALCGRVEHHTFLASAVEEAEPDGARDADTELVELLVGVEAAAHAGRGAMDPIDPADRER
jgi:hypothetical protein